MQHIYIEILFTDNIELKLLYHIVFNILCTSMVPLQNEQLGIEFGSIFFLFVIEVARGHLIVAGWNPWSPALSSYL